MKSGDKFYDRLLEFVGDPNLLIIGRWVGKKNWCEYSRSKNTMQINFPLFMATVAIHEYVHARWPSLEEATVVAKTERIINRLTVKQIRETARAMALSIERRMVEIRAAQGVSCGRRNDG